MVYLRYYIVELALVEYMRLLYRAFITFVVKDPNFVCIHSQCVVRDSNSKLESCIHLDSCK